MESSEDITRKAKSNLAFALGILPKEKRRDLTTFYAFCRSVDDLADDEDVALADRRQALAAWRRGLREGFDCPNPLQQELIELRDRHEIPNDLLLAIIGGCEDDLDKNRYQNWQELDSYIWKVACAVGLVCIRLFGCSSPASRNYAENLGRALQITNILRDVGEDLKRDRIYLPLDDLRQFGCSEDQLIRHTHDEHFVKLMEFQAKRAEQLFEKAELNITQADRLALRPAMIMAAIYRRLLSRMRADGFRVFDRRYRIGKPSKLLIGLRHLFA